MFDIQWEGNMKKTCFNGKWHMTITTSQPFEWTGDQNIIEAPCCDFKTLPCINFALIMLFWNEQDAKDSHFSVDGASFFLFSVTCTYDKSWEQTPSHMDMKLWRVMSALSSVVKHRHTQIYVSTLKLIRLPLTWLWKKHVFTEGKRQSQI